MNALEQIFYAVLDNSWRTALAVAALLLSRRFLRGRIPAAALFALWIVIAVRLLIPGSIPAAWSPYNVLPDFSTPAPAPTVAPAPPFIESIPVGRPLADAGRLAAPPASPKIIIPTFAQFAAIVWALGAVGFLAFRLATAVLFLRRLRRDRHSNDPRLAGIVASCCADHGFARPLPLLTTTLIDAPALHGIFRPTLLFPKDFAAQLTEDELALVIRHELTHCRRLDLATNALLQFAASIHWFNPLVWAGFKSARLDCELACDEHAMRKASSDVRGSYAETLLKVLGLAGNPRRFPSALGILESKKQIQQRLRMILSHRKASPLRTTAGVLVVLIVSFTITTRELSAQSPASPSPANATNASAPRVVTIVIADNGDILVDGFLTSQSGFANRLSEIGRQSGRSIRILVQGGPKSSFPVAITVLDELRSQGFGNLSLETRSVAASTGMETPPTPQFTYNEQRGSFEVTGFANTVPSQASTTPAPGSVRLTVAANTLAWDGQALTFDKLAGKLAEQIAQHPDADLYIHADFNAHLSPLFPAVINEVRKAGMQKVFVETRPANAGTGTPQAGPSIGTANQHGLAIAVLANGDIRVDGTFTQRPNSSALLSELNRLKLAMQMDVVPGNVVKVSGVLTNRPDLSVLFAELGRLDIPFQVTVVNESRLLQQRDAPQPSNAGSIQATLISAPEAVREVPPSYYVINRAVIDALGYPFVPEQILQKRLEQEKSEQDK